MEVVATLSRLTTQRHSHHLCALLRRTSFYFFLPPKPDKSFIFLPPPSPLFSSSADDNNGDPIGDGMGDDSAEETEVALDINGQQRARITTIGTAHITPSHDNEVKTPRGWRAPWSHRMSMRIRRAHARAVGRRRLHAGLRICRGGV